MTRTNGRKMKEYIVDGVSVRGYAHILNDKERQDAVLTFKERSYSVVIVCDGHGGDKYFRSACGAKIACEVGKDAISQFMTTLRKDRFKKYDFLKRPSKREEMLFQLQRAIIQYWVDCVNNDIQALPFANDKQFAELDDADKAALATTPIKAYGSTFVAAVSCAEFLLVLKLGDGNVCTYDGNEVQILDHTEAELADEQLQFNITTSLCGSNADVEFKHYFRPRDGKRNLQGIAVTTDGIINSFKTENAYKAFIANIFGGYREDGMQKAHDDLADFLPRLSEKGSGDDLSVAIMAVI